MKARKRDSNDEWKDVIYVQLEGSDILYKESYLEFDTLSTKIKTNEQIADEKHWQDVRERAAIASLSGILADYTCDYSAESMVESAIGFADELVKQLKGE